MEEIDITRRVALDSICWADRSLRVLRPDCREEKMRFRLILALVIVVTLGEVASAQFTFRQRNNGAAARFGFGNSRFRAGLTADQGSSISTSMNAPTLTIPANGSGSFFSGTLRPFVTGFTPVVGRGGFYPTPWQRRVTNVGQRQWSTAVDRGVDRQAQREEARSSRRLRVIERYQQRAEHERRMGRDAAARMYYRMALKRASGEQREIIVAKLEELE